MGDSEKMEVLSGCLEVLPDGGLRLTGWHINGGQMDGGEPYEAAFIGLIIKFLQEKRQEALGRGAPVLTVELRRPALTGTKTERDNSWKTV